MGHAIEFIETSLFTRSIHQIVTDDELRTLQNDPRPKGISFKAPAGFVRYAWLLEDKAKAAVPA